VAPEAIPALLEQIDELLAEPPSEGEPPTLARLERTLTDGYAYALALEAERWRLEQRLSELAAELHEGDQDEKSQELAQISRRLSSNESALEGLRSTLARLRNHATAVRGGATPAI
jgi:ABC-type phosphate transport system auxiliary subunit